MTLKIVTSLACHHRVTWHHRLRQ